MGPSLLGVLSPTMRDGCNGKNVSQATVVSCSWSIVVACYGGILLQLYNSCCCTAIAIYEFKPHILVEKIVRIFDISIIFY